PEKLRNRKQSSPAKGYLVKLLAVLAAGLQISTAVATAAPSGYWMLTQSDRVDLGACSGFDLVVVESDADLVGNRAGRTKLVLARLEPDRVETGTTGLAAASAAGVGCIMHANGKDGALDVASKGWVDSVIARLRDFDGRVNDGWVLDGLGRCLRRQAFGHEPTVVIAKWRELVVRVKAAFPEKKVFLGDAIAATGSGFFDADGLLVEGVLELGDEDRSLAAAGIREVAGLGKTVLALETRPMTAVVEANDVAAQLRQQGAWPYVTTSAREGVSLAPLSERSRRILVLFGWDPLATEKPVMWPVDTMTAELFQTTLEYMGYEVDYLDVGQQSLPAVADLGYAAVLLDAELVVPAPMEVGMVRWLTEVKARKVPILFAGGFPFSREDAAGEFAVNFGLRGSTQAMSHLSRVEIKETDEAFIHSETPIQPRATDYKDLAAPDGAHVILGLRAIGDDGTLLRFDPVFLADWGGMWLEPYIILRASADSSLFYIDPYKLLAAWLEPLGVFPAPDATTRDGQRIFYSHIDGDGFASDSDFKGHPFCAELVRDRILKVFPFPVTVSVVEADMGALAAGLRDGDEGKIQELAKSIYALPHVQAASHSFSHPYQWDPDDPNPGVYDEAFMALKAVANYTKVDPEREIRGSIRYINENLLPADKRVELMLWSGNCRPGRRALEVCRELGVENMNGGNTIISRLYPGVAGIAPRVIPWAGELQINAANQNEFMYANGWMGPFYGGFADVIDTFERTEEPIRTKPVNVYYHFYSATSLSALRALEKIHRWCASQSLHSVTARQYAGIVRDAWRTRVYELGNRYWLMANAGDCRTFRLPASVGRPDLASSLGVTGWAEKGDDLFIHTNGSAETILKMQDTRIDPPSASEAYLRLVGASSELTVHNHETWKFSFTIKDLRPTSVMLAGLPAGAECDLSINGELTTQKTDERGRLTLSLPNSADVMVDASRARYATSP
ncbi:MAG: hypothetical protein KDK97_09830, partial [Verrucomicrobiales bacterium]|nr:hypothetical protein [Verrucomicrobiales bacterium]